VKRLDDRLRGVGGGKEEREGGKLTKQEGRKGVENGKNIRATKKQRQGKDGMNWEKKKEAKKNMGETMQIQGGTRKGG